MSDGQNYQVKRVFIASPGDLGAERGLFPHLLELANTLKAHGLGIHLEPLGWEDTVPGIGRPQKHINEDVKKCDLFVMLLWKRWGTPSGKYASGVEEEFELARRLHKTKKKPEGLWLFFRHVPEAMMADPGDQLKQVLEFRRWIESERICLCHHYQEPADWEKKLLVYLCKWLDGQGAALPVSSPKVEMPPDVREKLDALEGELQKERKGRESAEVKLRLAAVDLARRALKSARNGRLTEAEQNFAAALQAYPAPEVLNSHGVFLLQIGALDGAAARFEELARTADRLGDTFWAAAGYGNLGIVYQTRGDLDKAEEMHRKALALNEELGRKEGMANAYGNLGNVYETRGDLHKTEEMYRKALALHEELGGKEGMANAYGNLGIVYKTRGDLDKAQEMYWKALALDEELGRKGGMAADYCNLGNVYKTRGDLEQAEEMHRKALALYEKLGSKKGMADAYCNLGNVYDIRGDLEQAEEIYRKALALHEELRSKEGMAADYCNLGIVYKTRGDLEQAEEMWEQALTRFQQLGAQPMVQEVGAWLADLRRGGKGRRRKK